MAVDVDTAGESAVGAAGHRADEGVQPAAEVEDESPAKAATERRGPVWQDGRRSIIAGLMLVVVLAGLVGWLGYRGYAVHQEQQRHELFLQTARQGALNLTTISHSEADADVQRILDSATGSFFDEFQQRSKPFTDVVRQAQSTSVGEVTAAGIETETRDEARALVAVTVKTSSTAGTDQQPRHWRMRITVQRVDDTVKISNVEFVP